MMRMAPVDDDARADIRRRVAANAPTPRVAKAWSPRRCFLPGDGAVKRPTSNGQLPLAPSARRRCSKPRSLSEYRSPFMPAALKT